MKFRKERATIMVSLVLAVWFNRMERKAIVVGDVQRVTINFTNWYETAFTRSTVLCVCLGTFFRPLSAAADLAACCSLLTYCGWLLRGTSATCA